MQYRRQEAGFEWKTSALMLFIVKTTVSRYERDEYDISAGMIVEISKALNTTPNYLLLGREDAYDQTDEFIRIICRIKDPAHKRLAVMQLECIAAMEEER